MKVLFGFSITTNTETMQRFYLGFLKSVYGFDVF